MNIKDARAKHLQKVDKTKQERIVKDLKDARDGTLLAWVTDELGRGESWDVIRKKLGLGPANEDRRWREIRKQVMTQFKPEGEDESLIEYHERFEDAEKKMFHLLETLEERIAKGPINYEKVEDGPDGKVTTTDNQDKTYLGVLQLYGELLVKVKEHSRSRHEAYLNTKKIKQGTKGQVSIKIYNNVPRPNREVSPATAIVIDAKPVEESDE